MTSIEAKIQSKNVDVRRYPNGFMSNSVEDASVLIAIYGYSSFAEKEYDNVLRLLGEQDFSLTVRD